MEDVRLIAWWIKVGMAVVCLPILAVLVVGTVIREGHSGSLAVVGLVGVAIGWMVIAQRRAIQRLRQLAEERAGQRYYYFRRMFDGQNIPARVTWEVDRHFRAGFRRGAVGRELPVQPSDSLAAFLDEDEDLEVLIESICHQCGRMPPDYSEIPTLGDHWTVGDLVTFIAGRPLTLRLPAPTIR